MRFMRECWVCCASEREAREVEGARGWNWSLTGEGCVDFAGDVDFGPCREVGSMGFSGEIGALERDGRWVSEECVDFVGDTGVAPGKEVKKLTANAGFSRIIRRKRKSSLCFRGLPGRRSKTSHVLINERKSCGALDNPRS